jgi:hypothetical protein
MSSSIDPLVALVLIASVAAAILSVFSALLAWRQKHCLTAMQTRLDNLSSKIRRLESDDERLFIQSMNFPRRRKARKSSSPSSDTLEEKIAAPAQPNVVAPKTS